MLDIPRAALLSGPRACGTGMPRPFQILGSMHIATKRQYRILMLVGILQESFRAQVSLHELGDDVHTSVGSQIACLRSSQCRALPIVLLQTCRHVA